jgi:hypothetical protein
MRDFFLSYRHGSAEAYVAALGRELRALGHETWIDRDHVRLDEKPLLPQLARGLAESRAFVAVAGPEYPARKWPRRELRAMCSLATFKGLFVCVVLLDVTREALLAQAPQFQGLPWIDGGIGSASVAQSLSWTLKRHQATRARVGDQAYLDALRTLGGGRQPTIEELRAAEAAGCPDCGGRVVCRRTGGGIDEYDIYFGGFCEDCGWGRSAMAECIARCPRCNGFDLDRTHPDFVFTDAGPIGPMSCRECGWKVE